MAAKCLPKCLPNAPQPSTSTSRWLEPLSRGLVDTCVEGWKLPIRFIQAVNGELGRGCRYFFSNFFTKKENFKVERSEEAYGNNNRDKYLHPLHT